VWDVLSGEEVKKLVGHTSSIRSVAFSTDGKHIVSGLHDNMMQGAYTTIAGNLKVKFHFCFPS